MKLIIVFDNGGETADRYTIVNTHNGDIFGASTDPFHPQGFGQYAGNLVDNHYRVTFGYGWRNGHDERGIRRLVVSAIRDYISQAETDSKWLGKKIDEVKTLPKPVQQYIDQIKNSHKE